MVIRYAYAWADNDADQNNKLRPATIVLIVKNKVLVLPITHSLPAADRDFLEIPPTIKSLVGLDDQRQWILFDTYNEFTWMGYDVEPRDHYPELPAHFYRIVAERF